MVAVHRQRRRGQSHLHIDERQLQPQVDLVGRGCRGAESVRGIVRGVIDVAARLLVLDAVGLAGRVEGQRPQGIVRGCLGLRGAEFLQLERTAIVDEARRAQSEVVAAVADDERPAVAVERVGQALQVAAHGSQSVLDDGLCQQRVAVVGGVAVIVFVGTVDGVGQLLLGIRGP